MIALSTTIFSTLPPVVFRDTGKHKLGDTTRRVSKVATLDGGCVFTDNGSTPTDASIIIDLTEITEDEFATLRSMTSGYTTLHCATERGCFLVAPVSLTDKSLNLYIKEVLA